MSTVTLEDAQAHLKELIERLQPGDEITITRDHKPVAGLTAAGERRQLGTLQGTVQHMAPDCGAPLEDFKEHME